MRKPSTTSPPPHAPTIQELNKIIPDTHIDNKKKTIQSPPEYQLHCNYNGSQYMENVKDVIACKTMTLTHLTLFKVPVSYSKSLHSSQAEIPYLNMKFSPSMITDLATVWVKQNASLACRRQPYQDPPNVLVQRNDKRIESTLGQLLRGPERGTKRGGRTKEEMDQLSLLVFVPHYSKQGWDFLFSVSHRAGRWKLIFFYV